MFDMSNRVHYYRRQWTGLEVTTLNACSLESMTTPEPIHPGEHLAQIMGELGITQYRLAKTIGVPQIRIHDIVHCRRSITADTALRIGRALGMTPDFWLNLQRMYDLDVARARTDVSAIEPLVEVSA